MPQPLKNTGYDWGSPRMPHACHWQPACISSELAHLLDKSSGLVPGRCSALDMFTWAGLRVLEKNQPGRGFPTIIEGQFSTWTLPAHFPLLGKCSNLIDNKLSSTCRFELGKMQALVVKEKLNVRHKPEEDS